jgi:tRNA(fMet)-specific endonuclease VapC
MLRNLLDTTLCIRLLRERPASLRPRFNAEAPSLCISTVVMTELLHGAFKSARPAETQRAVERLAVLVEVVPFDAAAAYHAADIKNTLERRGLPIGGYDILIAGHARSRGFVVITSNLGAFSRVEGLRCEDWLAS